MITNPYFPVFSKRKINVKSRFALKIQHGIFKLSILKKLKTTKCPCCNKPRNPKKKVKKTGHRIDCICIKCSSLLVKNLQELVSKEPKGRGHNSHRKQTSPTFCRQESTPSLDLSKHPLTENSWSLKIGFRRAMKTKT
jgi:hypothetical protein